MRLPRVAVYSHAPLLCIVRHDGAAAAHVGVPIRLRSEGDPAVLKPSLFVLSPNTAGPTLLWNLHAQRRTSWHLCTPRRTSPSAWPIPAAAAALCAGWNKLVCIAVLPPIPQTNSKSSSTSCPFPPLAMTNPKPTSYADRAAAPSDRVTRAAKRASSVPTSDPAVAVAAAATTPVAVAGDDAAASVPTAGATPAHTVPVASAVVAALDATRAKAAAPAAKAAASVAKAATRPRCEGCCCPCESRRRPRSLDGYHRVGGRLLPPPPPPLRLPNAMPRRRSSHPRARPKPLPQLGSPGAPPAVMQTPVTSAPTPGVPAAASTPRVRSPGPDFPPAPNSSGAPPKSHAQKRKEKGKAKAKVPRAPSPISPTPSPTHSDDEDFFGDGCTSYDLDADLDRALKMSVGQPTDMDTGASSSRRAATRLLVNGPPASPKRPRTDSSARDAPASPPKRPRDDREDHEEAQERRDSERRDAQERRPTFNRYPPAYDTRDGNPPQGSFVPHHPLLTRAVYGMTGGVLFRNHPSGQLHQWNEVPQPKVVATISGGNGDRIQTAERVRANLAGRFNLPPDELLIGTPGLAERSGPDPIAWLIAGLSVAHAQTLIDIGCLCSDTLTMFFHEYQPQITGFVGTFYGFTIPESSAALAHRTIVAAIKQCLVRFGEHIDTVAINLLSPRGPFVVWNVYIRPPTSDEDVFAELLGLFRLLVIDTPFHGQGRIYPRPLHCNICLSIDHPTNLCLLPSIPGWLGPTPRNHRRAPRRHPASRPRDDTNNKGKGKGPGKGKDRDDRKGGDRRQRELILYPTLLAIHAASYTIDAPAAYCCLDTNASLYPTLVMEPSLMFYSPARACAI
ncbi:hypothetical protein B0H14DRAFT_3430786 [Mycena olivaceomarginata]|nr:hypothetical protein B0H14DRAFT_3430786 [Mycena olivaceomarginata]